MKKFLLAGVSFAVLLAGPVMAADLARPVYRASAVPVAVHSWTGFYVGVNAGYGWSNSEVHPIGVPIFCTDEGPGSGCGADTGPVAANASAAAIPSVLGTHPKGGVVGGQIGYNYQFGQWVAGLEADLSWTNINGSNTQAGLAPVVGFPGISIGAIATADQRLSYFGTVRGRLGFLPVNPLLVYVTGGLAYGEVKSSTAVAEVCNPNPATCGGQTFVAATGSTSSTRTGWTVGGGLEYAIATGWSLKGEYLYYNLGSSNYGLTPLTSQSAVDNLFTAVAAASTTTVFKGSIVRLGLNYKFGDAAAPGAYK